MADDEILAQVPDGWAVADDGTAIERTFTFDAFATAMAFMAATAAHAERADHHPEWRNVYDRVEVRLTTHSAGGLTRKDTALAAAMDRVARAVEETTTGG